MCSHDTQRTDDHHTPPAFRIRAATCFHRDRFLTTATAMGCVERVERPSHGVFLPYRPKQVDMKSTRKGLRNDELYKDNYERVACSECEETLKRENDPDEVYAVRTCPNCGKQWKELP